MPVADGADRVAVQLARCTTAWCGFSLRRVLGLPDAFFATSITICSLPWRSSVSTRMTSGRVGGAPRARPAPCAQPSWLHSSMTFTIPAQTTSFSSPAWVRNDGGTRIRPKLSSGHSCAGAT